MTELEEYNFCVVEIEKCREQRNSIDKEVKQLTVQIDELRAKLAELLEQDEKIGEKMHELAIRRNLLEP